MSEAPRDQNYVPSALGQSSTNALVTLPFRIDSATGRLLTDLAGGSGTVTDVSVVTANGFAGTVANSTSTPAITISTTINAPVLAGNGTAISAATTTGSGSTVVLNNTPTLITPVIGAATGTSLAVTGLLASATGLTLEETGAGTDIITIQAPASIAASYSLTLPVDDGNNGEVLSTNGSGVLSWITPGGVPTLITVANEATDTSCFIAFFAAATGDLGPKTNANMTFDSNTGVVTFGQTVVASITGNAGTSTVATNVTVADEATDTTCFLNFTTAATGNLGVKTNANMTFNSNTGVVTFASSVLTTTDINGGTIDGTVIGGSSAAAITGTLITGNAFVPNSNTVPSNGLYLPAGNTLGWAINGSAELQLTATAFSPAADGGNSLGTTALGWQNLFGNTGFVFNIENGDWVATHTAGILTVGTGDLRVTTAGTNGASVMTNSGTQTFSNKRRTRRVVTVNVPGATPSTNSDNDDIASFTGLDTAITSMTTNLSGTPVDGDLLEFRFTDDGTPRAIAWGASFASTTITLPTTTVASTMLRVGFEWSGSTWKCIAVA